MVLRRAIDVNQGHGLVDIGPTSISAAFALSSSLAKPLLCTLEHRVLSLLKLLTQGRAVQRYPLIGFYSAFSRVVAIHLDPPVRAHRLGLRKVDRVSARQFHRLGVDGEEARGSPPSENAHVRQPLEHQRKSFA